MWQIVPTLTSPLDGARLLTPKVPIYSARSGYTGGGGSSTGSLLFCKKNGRFWSCAPTLYDLQEGTNVVPHDQFPDGAMEVMA